MSISQNFPNTRPSLSLNFARSQTLDPRITFTRTTSGTRVGPDGYIEVIPADQPRFDFDPVTGECLGLLIEEQRVNRCTQSVNFGYSSTSNTTETNVFNPDGTAAVRRVPLSTGNFHGTSSNAAVIDITGQSVGETTDVTTSIFVRNYNNSNLRLLIGFVAFDATPTYRYFLSVIDTAIPTTLNIPSGIGWSNGSTKVENYGNGWYRYTLSGRYNKVAGFNTISFVGEQIHSSTGQQFWFGDDVSGIYTWGKQIELGLFSTSYIPTAGSTVTRTADNASITGSNFTEWYNPSEGTIYTQFRCDNCNPSNSFGKVFTINEGIFGVENNGFWIGNDANTSNSVRYRVRESGTNQFGPANLIRNSNIVKSALSVKTSDFAVTIDGNAPTTSTSGTLSTSMTNMTIGRDIVGIDNQFLNGTISQLTYYPTRLSNQVLQNLTK